MPSLIKTFNTVFQANCYSYTVLSLMSGLWQNGKREPKSMTMKQCRNKQSSWFINVAGVRSQAVSQRRRTNPVRSRQTGVQGKSRQVTTEIRQKTSQEGKRWKARYEHTKPGVFNRGSATVLQGVREIHFDISTHFQITLEHREKYLK